MISFKNAKILKENMEKENKPKTTKVYKSRYLTGEDIDMLREKDRESESKHNKDYNICDHHEDGA